jgi:Tol biopolymer transport system component/C-terminal processing protease CtpA/Prc
MYPLRYARRSSRSALLAISLVLPFLVIDSAGAQLPPPEEKPAVGARMPALSPDGKTLAFVWRGDIWISPSSGGRAYPITSHVELDAYPIFSPDGKWIAFSSPRNGNWDIFVVPATGGTPRQLTFSSGSEIATDWSPDGKTLLFSAQRDAPNSTIFALDVATLRFKKLTEDYIQLSGATYSPDGKTIAFQRYGFPWTRPRYNGTGAARLWSLDLATGKRNAIADNERQHLWPKFSPDGKSVLCITASEDTPNAQWLNKPLPRLQDSEKRTPNLWSFPAGGGSPKQLTKFVGGSVRFPTIARQSGDIVFEYEQDLYRLPKDGAQPVKLTLFCTGDDKQNNLARQVFTNSDVEEAEISPDGKTYAFLVRGDIWTIPVEKAKNSRNADLANRLTDWAGFDRDFWWGKDNKSIYFISDRNNNDRLFRLDTTTKAVTPIWTGSEDARSPNVSPDGSLVGFWVRGSVGESSPAGLYIWPTKGDTTPKRLVAIPGAVQGDFSISPDARWVAFSRRGIESGGTNLYIAPVDGSKPPVNVTQLNAFHSGPVWSPDGKYLFFSSNREGDGIYVLPLKPEDARTDELEIKFEKPKTPLTIEIDFEDTAQRIRRVPNVSGGELTVTEEGNLVYNSGGNVFMAAYDGKDPKQVTGQGGVGNLRVSPDGKTAFFYRGGSLWSVRLSAPYPQTQVTFTANWERDVRAERMAAFNQFWRSYNTRFYDGNFHGRDWMAIRKRYEPLLEAVGTRDEFATLLNMMIGEVEASHSEVGPAPSGINGPSTRHLGVVFDYSYNGPGIKVKEVPKRAPGSYAKTRIKPGEYILEVDGKPVTLDENLYKVLNDKGDRDFVLLVNDRPSREGARTVTYKALTGGEWGDIDYRNRVERMRKLVEQKSGGTLGYVHIAGMGGPNQVAFDREFYEYAEGKKGVIVDVRFNGGGNIADQIVNWLAVKPYGTYYPRDGYPIPAPGGFISSTSRAWNKPIIVLMNERSMSNAEMFPYSMRATGLAKLVGQPTPGYVIWTSGLPLVDGSSARIPHTGAFRKDGSPMENYGEKPDVLVPLSMEDWLAGRDPQLEKAIELLMK